MGIVAGNFTWSWVTAASLDFQPQVQRFKAAVKYKQGLFFKIKVQFSRKFVPVAEVAYIRCKTCTVWAIQRYQNMI